MAEQKKEVWLRSVFTTKEEFVKEVEKVFTSLKSRNPFLLGVNMRFDRYSRDLTIDADIQWRIDPPVSRPWSLPELELVLSVLASRQTPNVTETHLNFEGNNLGDISAEVWKLCSKFNNLTYLHIGSNKLSVISPLVCDLVHLQQLHLVWNKISAEGVVGVCELLKVCCSVVCWLIVLDILS